MAQPVAIVAALREELSAIEARVGHRAERELAGMDLTVGVWEGRRVVLASTGEGARRAGRVEQLLHELRPSHLLVVGVAGGLSPDLAPTEVVIGQELRRAGADFVHAASLASRHPRTRPSVVVSHSQWVATPEQKRALWHSMAPSRSAVVDLESWTFVQSAQDRRIPWTVLRAVLDAHDELVPHFLLQCRNEDGTLSRRKLAVHCLRHPSEVGSLLALRTRMRACARSLAEAASDVVRGC